jgi:hypothetical protein
MKAQKTYRISIPPRSYGTELHRAIVELAEEAKHDRLGEVHLHAESLRFSSPSEVCGLRAVIDQAAEAAEVVSLGCPGDPSVHAYLSRMDFYADLPDNVFPSRSPVRTLRRNRHESLIELTRVRTDPEMIDALDRVMTVARREFPSGPMLHAFGAAFGETLANAVEHAHSRFGALVCAQRYEAKRLELSVVDLGIGIRQSLARNPAYRTLDDAAAVRCALQQGVSGVELPGRGTGLSELVVRAGLVPRSVIRLLSGTAGVDVHPMERDPIYYDSSHVVEVPGTWIHVRLES